MPNTQTHRNRRTKGISVTPLHSLVLISENGPLDLPTEEISGERVGWKAFGLCSLPQEWVPPFFLITNQSLENCSDEELNQWITECLNKIGLNSKDELLIRSSGVNETIQTRGQLDSKSCSPSEILTTIRDLMSNLPKSKTKGEVHWVIQKNINSRKKGHLSNERRLFERKRDWILVFEAFNGDLEYQTEIHVRQWRDGKAILYSKLRCGSEIEISIRLKNVANWANQFYCRTHYEWVWDGNTVYVVQLEIADYQTGVIPSKLLPKAVSSVSPSNLKVFRVANDNDYKLYRKLRNAALYKEFGYKMPSFYVIDDANIIKSLLSGEVLPELKSDLIELTKRPLIIRTDGTKIPDDKREMLPRSDELRSYSDAESWLINNFSSLIKESNLANYELCLIAHHFIPSVASAWARAEPGNRIVRIESLWGIPEGLYWFSHDTFEVDTNAVVLDLNKQSQLNYKFWGRRRYKGTFIASNDEGRWIKYQTLEPFDWGRSVKDKNWLFEIAYVTRRIAENESRAVAVMWFIDNHPQATKHKVLPWFHSKSDIGAPIVAPRQKRKGASDYKIESVDDWLRLQKFLEKGNHVERVIVQPVDEALIRNREFAEQLAKLAKTYDFVIEMYGGILSHAYYIFQREGAKVECVDLFGAEVETIEFNKIVRDKIPSIIERRGEQVETVQLKDDALIQALQQKLVEEAFEVLDAQSGEDLIAELADVEEVIRGLCKALKINFNEVEIERENKESKRGGFNKGLMLIKTMTPHSIQKNSVINEFPAFDNSSEQIPTNVITNADNIPTKSLYLQPDLRRVDERIEKILRFETESNSLKDMKEVLNFSLPIGNDQQGFSLTVELRRKGSSIRGSIRLRLEPLQLQLDFPEFEIKP